MKSKLILFFAISLFAHTGSYAQTTLPGNTPGDVGSVTFTYRGSPATYVVVRAKDGQAWLQQNLGATRVADSAADQNSYGDYFQWGRWDDGHQLSTSTMVAATTLSSNDPLGLGTGLSSFIYNISPAWWAPGLATDTWSGTVASATNGKDPCTALGAGWHIPDTSEWGKLVAAENITNPATAYASNLKLPLAGLRNPFGGMQVQGMFSYFWANSIYLYNGVSYGMMLYVQNTSASTNTGSDRSYGYAIRCLGGICVAPGTPASIEGDSLVCPGSTQTYSATPVSGATGYTWTLPNGWTGTSNANTITVTAGNSGGTISVNAKNGCDGPVKTFTVAVATVIPAQININGAVLGTTVGYSTYQWYKNSALIPGATNPTYTVTTNGDYSVVVTDANGCKDSSRAYDATNVGINTIAADAAIVKIFPNPANDIVHIDASVSVNVTIYSVDGKIVLQQNDAKQLNISGLTSGAYIMKIVDKDGVFLKAEKLFK